MDYMTVQEAAEKWEITIRWVQKLAFLENTFSFSNEDALMIYQKVTMNNIDIFIYIAVILCFFLLCRILISRFMRYFDEINAGIDTLQILHYDTLLSTLAFVRLRVSLA